MMINNDSKNKNTSIGNNLKVTTESIKTYYENLI